MNRKFLLFILFACFAIANTVFASSPIVALSKWTKVLEFLLLGLYVVKTKPKIDSVVFFLSIGVFYTSLVAIAQFVLQHSVGGLLWFFGERTFTASTPGIAQADFQYTVYGIQYSVFKLRAYATFPHPNVLGGYLAAIIPLIIYQFTNLPIAQMKKVFYGITIILGVVALVVTFSRSALGIFLLEMSIVFWKYIFSARGRSALGGHFSFFNFHLFTIHKISKYFFVALFLSACTLFAFTFNWSDESVVVREQLNVAAVSMVAHSPLLGVGLGNYLVKLPETLVSRGVYFLQPAHNLYLLILSETGVAGFVLLVLLLRKFVMSKELRMRNSSIQYMVYGILYLGLVDHYMITLQQGQLLFTLLLALSFL